MTTWPDADARLERRYRRLLLAYPGRYRRTEMVTTLLEMAGPGQSRPAAADVRHLLLHGLRQRFRLPAGRPLAWVAAMLTTLILGAFGAAAGSWVAERTFTGLPSDTAFTALLTRVAGPAADPDLNRQASPWTRTTLLGSAEQRDWSPDPGRRALAADGWRLTPVEVRHIDAAPAFPGEPALPATLVRFDATRDGLRLTVNGHQTGEHGVVTLGAVATDNGTLLPLVVIGALAGLLAGWPVAAAVAYRFRRRPPGRARAAAVTTGLALAALVLPAVAFFGNMLRLGLALGRPWPEYTVHSALNPGPYWPFGPPWLTLGLSLTGLALALVAAGTLLPRPAEPDGIPATG